ncbi:NAD-dependent epimerase/dehydratase family protein [Mycobacterium sp. DL440]|uniref:NAD-dependent epimerase/dehydratase family protein n=1 Tax=Mycobacterium sp. DL440 TaxID=2675523 RepID=UPI001420493F|nr:NAD-dependent epimerase/dehydratase family protein [Mycobacterium sp. DL440]
MTRVVVIGGSGLIGSKLVSKLKQHGHQVVADPRARYCGAVLEKPSLLPCRRATLFSTSFAGRLADNASVAVR